MYHFFYRYCQQHVIVLGILVLIFLLRMFEKRAVLECSALQCAMCNTGEDGPPAKKRIHGAPTGMIPLGGGAGRKSCVCTLFTYLVMRCVPIAVADVTIVAVCTQTLRVSF